MTELDLFIKRALDTHTEDDEPVYGLIWAVKAYRHLLAKLLKGFFTFYTTKHLDEESLESEIEQVESMKKFDLVDQMEAVKIRKEIEERESEIRVLKERLQDFEGDK